MRRLQTVLCTIGLAVAIGAAAPLTQALAQAQSAGPALAPAEYKPLPVGTRVDYDTWSYTVTKSNGFDITYKDDNGWAHHYAIFGKAGDGVYEEGEDWSSTLDGKSKQALEGLWPLKVGNKVLLETREETVIIGGYDTITADWEITIEVTGTRILDLNGVRFVTYVVHERAATEGEIGWNMRSPSKYVTTHWYHPGSGLILKASKKWIDGPSKGEEKEYRLTRVRYPAGTTNLALKGTPVGAAPAPTQPVAPPSAPKRAAMPAPRFLGRDRLEEIFVGNTMTFKSKTGGPLFLYIEPDGLVRGAYEAEPDRVFRKKWWFKGDDMFCRTYQADDREICLKFRGGNGRFDVFTPDGTYRFQVRVLEGKRLPEASFARKARAAEIARLKQEAEIERLKIERLKAEAEVARLKRTAETPLKPAPLPTSPARRGAGEDRMERALWSYAKGSRDSADAQAYLDRYPGGRFAADAQARIKVLSELSTLKGIDFGNYHALVIGNNDYKHLPDLQTAVNDAQAVAEVLANGYGFKVLTLINATRSDIIEALDSYRETLTDNDNLLIYYAGHGWLDEDVNRGYWLPVDARRNRRTNWVSNATISDTLTAVLSKHVMVVADSCYSGTLTRGAGVKLRSGDYWRRMARKRTRVALTSGGLEPVADKGGGSHSPFAKAFIDTLKNNDAVIDGTQMFSAMRRQVMVNADQTPEYSDVRNTGHDGGDFLFVKKF